MSQYASETTGKKGSVDSKNSTVTAKTSVSVNGNHPKEVLSGTHSPVKEPEKVRDKAPAVIPQIKKTAVGFDPYLGADGTPANNQPAKQPEKTPIDPKKEVGSPNEQFFRRAKSAIVKLSSRSNFPRRANSLNATLGTRKPLSKQTSCDSNQSGNSGTPILYSSC
jgi:hypothetical protein